MNNSVYLHPNSFDYINYIHRITINQWLKIRSRIAIVLASNYFENTNKKLTSWFMKIEMDKCKIEQHVLIRKH